MAPQMPMENLILVRQDCKAHETLAEAPAPAAAAAATTKTGAGMP